MTEQEYQQRHEAECEKLTAMLKAVHDHASFKRFVLAVQGSSHHVELRGKRRGYRLFGFTELHGRAHYLMDDGVSGGCCEWKNLWRVVRVE